MPVPHRRAHRTAAPCYQCRARPPCAGLEAPVKDSFRRSGAKVHTAHASAMRPCMRLPCMSHASPAQAPLKARRRSRALPSPCRSSTAAQVISKSVRSKPFTCLRATCYPLAAHLLLTCFILTVLANLYVYSAPIALASDFISQNESAGIRQPINHPSSHRPRVHLAPPVHPHPTPLSVHRQARQNSISAR